ncbi:MAG: hypothetical protein LBF05_05035 [Tannerella sp.]|jgi:hypothetical protein|nr:hypothetical protein [Tannerella sp.]
MNKLYIYWTLKDLKNLFATDFPQICQAAMETVSVADFKQRLTALFPYDTVRELIRYDGKTVTDFSTGKEVPSEHSDCYMLSCAEKPAPVKVPVRQARRIPRQ